jgi:hypothetical protein
VNPRNENFWVRAMEEMGLQPLHANDKPGAIMAQDASITMNAPAPMGTDPAPESKKTTILDLPNETQKAIFEHASSLSVTDVSKSSG